MAQNLEQIAAASYDTSVTGLRVVPVLTPGSASLRTTPGPVSSNQTQKTFSAKVATSTSATTPIALTTVTAGKTYYITDILMYTDQTTPVDLAIQAAGATIFAAGPQAGSGVQAANIATQAKAAASQAVTLLLPITTAVQNVWYFISGYEQ